MENADFGLYFFLLALALVLLVCWIVLPFAVIGTKPILRDILEQQRQTNANLAALTKAIEAARRPAPAAAPSQPEPPERTVVS